MARAHDIGRSTRHVSICSSLTSSCRRRTGCDLADALKQQSESARIAATARSDIVGRFYPVEDRLSAALQSQTLAARPRCLTAEPRRSTACRTTRTTRDCKGPVGMAYLLRVGPRPCRPRAGGGIACAASAWPQRAQPGTHHGRAALPRGPSFSKNSAAMFFADPNRSVTYLTVS